MSGATALCRPEVDRQPAPPPGLHPGRFVSHHLDLFSHLKMDKCLPAFCFIRIISVLDGLWFCLFGGRGFGILLWIIFQKIIFNV